MQIVFNTYVGTCAQAWKHNCIMLPCGINDYILFNRGMKDALMTKEIENSFYIFILLAKEQNTC